MLAPLVRTYLIDYPEARTALEYLGARQPLDVAGVFEPIGLTVTKERAVARPLSAEPFIVLNGSGNYHHETVALVEGFLERRSGQILYLQIDAHPDKSAFYRWRCNCGSFVGRLMEHPRIESVNILGLHPACLDTDGHGTIYDKDLRYYRCDYFAKLRQYLVAPSSITETFFGPMEDDLRSAKRNPSVRKLEQKQVQPPGMDAAYPALVVSWRTLDELDLNALPELPVYLSIDLDVVKDRPVTDWRNAPKGSPNAYGVEDNQGIMGWQTLLDLVARIGAARQILGADVCGLTSGVDSLPEIAKTMSLESMAQIHRALAAAIDPTSTSANQR